MDIFDNKSIRIGIIIFIVLSVLTAALVVFFKNMNTTKPRPTLAKLFVKQPNKESKKAQELEKQHQLLEEEKKQIDAEWDELEEAKQELSNREALLLEKQGELEELEKELGVLQDKLETKLKNIKELAQYYELMETRDAAKILANTEDEFIIQLISHMKKEKASEILSNLEPKKAASITKKMGGI